MSLMPKNLLVTALLSTAANVIPAHAVSLADLLKGVEGKSQQGKKTSNQFGATVRNPGSVMPEWWNEEDYVPETIDGALRLRIGSSGANGIYTVLGRTTCDLVLLYYAKSGQQILPSELSECALLEYHLTRGITGEEVNLADTFAKQDTIAKFSKVLLERMAKLKDAELFYSRAGALNLAPYNLATNTMELSANLTSNLTERFMYTIGGSKFPKSDSWFSVDLAGLSPDAARSLESARAGYRVDTPQNLFIYKVNGTRQAGQRRVVNVELVKFQFQYRDEKNNRHTISF